jgi:uncharacterized protein YgfB (UPF0149 family)
MNNADAPDYQLIANLLQQLDSEMAAVELHGLVCGCLCADNGIALDACVSLPPADDSNAELLQTARRILTALLESCRQQLNDPEFEFAPLLAGEELDTHRNVDALSEWCRGFLLGLAEGGLRDFSRLSDDAREFADDLLEISRIGTEYSVENSEEDAVAFEEVLEYVRIGVLLINEELNPLPPAAPGVH